MGTFANLVFNYILYWALFAAVAPVLIQIAIATGFLVVINNSFSSMQLTLAQTIVMMAIAMLSLFRVPFTGSVQIELLARFVIVLFAGVGAFVGSLFGQWAADKALRNQK